jgi:Fur family peroxide stress response transcriptional regulator
MILGKSTPMQPDLNEERFRYLTGKAREVGFRLTRQRQAVLRALLFSDKHPGADDLFRQVKGQYPDLSLATVYKCLDMLKSMGEVLQLEFRDGSSRFDGRLPAPHAHAVCTRCAAIVDATADPFTWCADDVATETGYRFDRYRFELYGLCPVCQAQTTRQGRIADLPQKA